MPTKKELTGAAGRSRPGMWCAADHASRTPDAALALPSFTLREKPQEEHLEKGDAHLTTKQIPYPQLKWSKIIIGMSRAQVATR